MRAPFSTSLRLSLLASLGLLPLACGGATLENGSSNGGTNAGGTDAGGTNVGGTNAGGTNVGGTNVGGTNIGGTNSGGTNIGGTNIGGTNSGGVDMGGTSQACTSPVVHVASGLVRCQEGFDHRPAAVSCVVSGNEGAAGAATDLPRASGSVPCAGNPTACAAFELGYCHSTPPSLATCRSGCREDSDCGEGFICHCSAESSAHGGECVPSDCQTDADCAAGSWCASGRGACGDVAFSCFKPADSCATDADCVGGICALSSGARACFEGACGRPFLVERAARLAPLARRSDWNGPDLTPCLEHLSPAERAAFAAHWSELGRMEHASIAAFARFQLQLLALGAPPTLVEACNRALADETLHTRLCFGLASAYAGRALGPGALDVAGSLEGTSLTDVVDLVLVEGCFGETSAALEAREAEHLAVDPVVRGVYARIAEDEQRHAELAFRFVSWALERGGAAVRARLADAVAHPPSASGEARAVAVPCLEALLGRPSLGLSPALIP